MVGGGGGGGLVVKGKQRVGGGGGLVVKGKQRPGRPQSDQRVSVFEASVPRTCRVRSKQTAHSQQRPVRWNAEAAKSQRG